MPPFSRLFPPLACGSIAGDNFYYLGFIYTLASLSAALVELRTGINSTAILGAFGVALITTIVGIADGTEPAAALVE